MANNRVVGLCRIEYEPFDRTSDAVFVVGTGRMESLAPQQGFVGISHNYRSSGEFEHFQVVEIITYHHNLRRHYAVDPCEPFNADAL